MPCDDLTSWQSPGAVAQPVQQQTYLSTLSRNVSAADLFALLPAYMFVVN